MTISAVCTLTGHTERVWDVAVSSKGVLASCGGDKTIRIWKALETEEGLTFVCESELKSEQSRTIREISWTPNGLMLAAGSFDGTVAIWQVGTQYDCLSSLEGHENEVKSVAWSPDGKLLATCGRDKSVWIWEMDPAEELDCLSVLHSHTQDVKQVAFHPSSKVLASASYDDTIRLWREDGDDWAVQQVIEGHEATVWTVSFQPSTGLLASAGDSCSLRFYQAEDVSNPHSKWQEVLVKEQAATRTIYSVQWHPTKPLVAVGAGDNSVAVFEVSQVEGKYTLKEIGREENGHEMDINSVTWYSEGSNDYVISASDDMTLKVWKVET